MQSFIKRNMIVLFAFFVGLILGYISQIHSSTPPKADLVRANYYSAYTVPTQIMTNEEATIKDHAKYCPVTPVEK